MSESLTYMLSFPTFVLALRQLQPSFLLITLLTKTLRHTHSNGITIPSNTRIRITKLNGRKTIPFQAHYFCAIITLY
ncbi:hypothetical protein PanWU01x14_248490 [Parasponia andersonii]|uniref:Uncharacterized protein n=1 Tax=Parasponia andersonii TaxID=3476 RepID=A0A2P5BDJ6_PARAD|nr:hypothetical protein PanWU01x14_248490 [Parasponia andersonii]